MTALPEGRMEFACAAPAESRKPVQRRTGEVTVKSRGPCMAEPLIYGRGGCINAVTGKYMSGQYICIPDIDAGCPLSRLPDMFWSRERLSAHMNGTDAATVAHALRALSGYTGKDWL